MATVHFDDMEAAIAELDSRYIAGEAAPHAQAWSVITRAYTAVKKHELPAWTPDAVNIDHRRATAFASGELTPYLHAMWDQTPDVTIYIESVHRLTSFGALVTHVANGTSQQGFEGEWREITLSTIDGDRIKRSEMFDEAALDAALARFDELSRPAPRLENAASQVWERLNAHFSSGGWGAMSQLMAQNMIDDDRRRTVNGGIRRGKDIQIANGQAVAETGADKMTSTLIAIRGERLALCRSSFFVRDQQPETFRIEFLSVIEIDADGQLVGHVAFDLEDIDAAFEELDTRYLAGEAAAHARTWSVIADGYATLNRHELPPTPPDFVNLDHRRGGGTFAAGDLLAYVRASWDDTPDNKIRVESVHRLNDFGAVVSSATQGMSLAGFAAEWREIGVVTVDGGMINRTELFEPADLDAALARLDELSRRAPRLGNTASRVEARCRAHIAVGNWDAMATVMADDIAIDDRRRVVNAGLRRGRDAVIGDLRVGAEIGLTEIAPTAVATRGENLTLGHIRYSGGDQRPEAGLIDLVQLVEIDANERITALVLFDPDDLDAAFAELDTRYLDGEAAAHAHTYSVIAAAFAAVNRRELPSTTSELASIDHRRPVAFAPGELIPYLQATLNDSPEIRIDIEAVHRVSNIGAVVSHAWHNTSQQGFDAEWRVIGISTIDGDLIDRCELFDEADLDAALARFDELSRPAARLENAASQAHERFNSCYTSGDWDGLATTMADDFVADDRRRFVGTGGTQLGRNAAVDTCAGNRRPRCQERGIDRHRGPRGTARSHACPLLGSR